MYGDQILDEFLLNHMFFAFKKNGSVKPKRLEYGSVGHVVPINRFSAKYQMWNLLILTLQQKKIVVTVTNSGKVYWK